MILDQNSLLIAIGIAASGLMTTLLIAWTGARQDKYLLCWGGGLALIVMAVLIYGLYSEPYVPALQFAAFELLISGFALTISARCCSGSAPCIRATRCWSGR